MTRTAGKARGWRHGAAALLIAAIAALLPSLPVFDDAHGLDTDLLHWLRAGIAPVPAAPEDSAVAVVAIDNATYLHEPFRDLPKVMWTKQIAAVQDSVLAAGASVFAWDLVLSTSPNTYVDDPRYDKSLLVSLLKHGRREGRILLGDLKLGDEPLRPYRGFRRAVGDYRNIRSLNAYVDGDGILRGVPLFLSFQDDEETVRRTGMAMEIARRHLGEEPEPLPGGGVRFAGRTVPTDDAHNMILNFRAAPGAIPTYSLYDLYRCRETGNGDYFAKHFKDKAVILGLVLDLEDRKLAGNRLITRPDFAGAPETCTGEPVAVSSTERNSTPGVYIHATAVNNLVRGDAVARQDRPVQAAITLALALAAVALGWRLRPSRAAPAVLGAGIVYGLVATVVFRSGVQLPLIDPLAGGALAFGGMVLLRVATTDRERKRIRESFARYLDPQVIEEMLESGDVPELGGESRELTCFFSDIAGFSGISEAMTPNELVEFLNEYFAVIGTEIEAHGGIIERFLGDAVCAVFGAPRSDPDHALNAVRTALAIDAGLRRAEAEGRFRVPPGKTVRTRIGINSGTMTVGNVGSHRRHTYTVMGDAVNLAARLESGAKQFGVLLMAGEDVVAATGDAFEWRELDRVRVVGRDAPVTLYEPLGERGRVDAERMALKRRYEAALAQYRAGAFEAAGQAFRALAEETGDAASAKTAERVAETALSAPADWDGVTDLTAK